MKTNGVLLLAVIVTLPGLLARAAFTHVRPVATSESSTSDSRLPTVDTDRSPVDLALTPDGNYALTANSGSDTVSLVDLHTNRVLVETPVGRHPFCIAISYDGRRAVVTNQDSDSISLLALESGSLHVMRTISVGDEPRGVALSRDGATAYVVLSGEDATAFVDLDAGKVITKTPVGIEPWHVAMTPDGSRLAVGNVRSMDMSIIDVASRKLLYTVGVHGHNLRHIAISSDGEWAYVAHTFERGRPAVKDSIVRGWVIGNRLSRCPLKAESPRQGMALDPPGHAVGDLDGVALSSDGNRIAITAGGTHELLLFKLPLPFFTGNETSDFLDSNLNRDPNRFRRIPLGGRPLGVCFEPNGKTLVVANYLLNSLQVVNADTAQIERSIPLGGPAIPSLARQGEAIFLDANRSFTHWYSCNTCHVEGYTNGGNFDTFNDGSYGTLKKTLSLRGVTQTGPWTWHGQQKSLRQLVHDSLTKTMQSLEPSDADLDALLAYLATLDFRPNPNRNPGGSFTVEQLRGQEVFNAKGCNHCHIPPLYTSPTAYIIGLESSNDVYHGFNPPSLRGVYSRAPYLHEGQALTLREVLTKYHRSSQLSNKPDPKAQELDDLIAFLRAL